ncbi:2'-5'-oligoadenylate synthetase domain containing protein [Nitzschia inconspicua]|uniref:2'-5'-oligoadenylate synthetase domain containing protein n=1 Tax=Nitzschia inconspicua TaxID=303405 RepID=A0A9K3M413_9STRA|nr:2'-5'-oligoadenylate synthetase domain containing protein [Nitzschia inconspicua]
MAWKNLLPAILPGLEIEMTTRFSVQFYLDGFEVDLLPAPNFARDDAEAKEEKQFVGAMSRIKTLPEATFHREIRCWSSALAERIVAHMRQQQSFVNAANLNVSGVNHKERDVPERVLKQRPIVLDPVNPHYNLANQLKDWSSIRSLASASLALMKKEQLATALQVRTIASLQNKPMNPGVEWRSQARLYERACPKNIQNIILCQLNNFVQVSTTILLSSVTKTPNREVVKASSFVDNMLPQVFAKDITSWTPSLDSHESKDVSFLFGQVPIPSQPDDLRFIYLKLSVDLVEEQVYRLSYEIQKDLDRQIEEGEDY